MAPLHLLKVCVGVQSVAQLRGSQAARLARGETLRHVTRHTPKRGAEIVAGGSLYWIIKRAVRVRQRIVALEEVRSDTGKRCALVLDPELVATEPRPRRPHQGWRYFTDEDAPRDLAAHEFFDQDMPLELMAELKELGLM